MPLGVVSDDEFQSELDNSETQINGNLVTIGVVEKQKSRGRAPGDNNTPSSLQKLIAETDVLEGRSSAIELAKEFGLNPQAPAAYAAGASSLATYQDKKPELKDHLALIKKNASRRAGKKLLAALDKITEDKLDEAPAGVLANVAKSLSGVIRDLEPEFVRNPLNNNAQFIVFAPQVTKESSFDVIELKE